MGEAAPWWIDYFDETYLRIYETFLTPARTDREVAALRELLDDAPGDRVLDVACGWGRHAIELARTGFAVTGVDRSSHLLDEARKLAGNADSPPALVHADMRDLAFYGEFDAALSLFSSLGYFGSGDADDIRVLEGIRRALVANGVLIIETMHRDAVAREYAERDWWETPDGLTVWVEREFDPIAGGSDEVLRWRDASGQEGTKRHSIRIRSATEWNALLTATGFEPVEWFGGWDLEPFSLGSERLLIFARRH